MIEITQCKYLQKGALCAVIDIKLPKMMNFLINNITVWEKDGKKWVSMPSREYESEGKKKYFAYCRFEDRQVNDNFQTAILKAFDEHTEKQGKLEVPSTQEEELPF